MSERVKKELSLYRLREIEIDDMKLKVEELKIGEQLGAMNYEEKVQSSMKCKNNDYVMNEIETLEKKIRFNEIANKRIDNALKRLDIDEAEVIQKVFIEKKSITRASQELFKSRKSIKNSIDRAFQKLKLA
ncbi:sigma factor-like helix-turn-helix DNA-binding protein [Clostridium beijerinckii]|uniref:sigma factor-like helix-turn-helix DNA-binding protein n=1 Tax=Clostridium beijerinckii TaxID=1520 RepID=UPI0003D359E0|nr:sigma factor-like helix-turn-helix DNA-binding protein [Clostridium beijerinckii]ALB47795.1 RNA polymerase subunit sigma [Clostridium beijerinckii NRRL B-598]